MSFIQRAFVKWLLPQISSQMRSPESSFTGAIAMSLMKRFNVHSIREAIRRLQLKHTDTFVEIGAGNGDGLAALFDMDKASSLTQSKMPQRVVLIEISEPFREKLHKLTEQANSDTAHIEIHSEDCISMPYLNDNSVNKIFGFNLVYFLYPLDTYLQEMKRVLKPGGMVVFGCKFGSLPKKGETKEFVNTNRNEICAALSRQGFDVTMNKVVVDKENEMSNYIEIVGMKPFDVAAWERQNLVAVMESSQ
jgi:ubiquinone/menaquinone biosynthesis C-methylase UbiE